MSDRAEQIKANEDALKARLAKLRDFSENVAARLRELEMPKTYLEAARGARAVQQADRLLLLVPKADLEINGPLPEVEQKEDTPPPLAAPMVPLPSELGRHKDVTVPGYDVPDPKTGYQAVHPARLELRDYADRLMDAVGEIDEAQTYLEALRAARYGQAAERMLRQLYHLPDGGYGPWTYDHDEDEDEDWGDEDWDDEDWDDEDWDDEDGDWREDDESRSSAPRKPILGDPGFRHPDNDLCIALPGEEEVSDYVIFAACCHEHHNAGQARDTGFWPDGTPYDPADPWRSCPRLRYFHTTHPPP